MIFFYASGMGTVIRPGIKTIFHMLPGIKTLPFVDLSFGVADLPPTYNLYN